MFERYTRWCKVCMIPQTEVLFQSSPRMPQMTILNIYEEYWDCDTRCSKRLCQWAHLRYSVENIMLGTWTCKKRRFHVSICDYEGFEAPSMDDSFRVIVLLSVAQSFPGSKIRPLTRGNLSLSSYAPFRMSSAAIRSSETSSSSLLFVAHTRHCLFSNSLEAGAF